MAARRRRTPARGRSRNAVVDHASTQGQPRRRGLLEEARMGPDLDALLLLGIIFEAVIEVILGARARAAQQEQQQCEQQRLRPALMEGLAAHIKPWRPANSPRVEVVPAPPPRPGTRGRLRESGGRDVGGSAGSLAVPTGLARRASQ